MRDTVIAEDGIEIALDDLGAPAAAAVILAHGGGQTRFAWSGAASALVRAGYRVLNYDARGHGESGWSHDNRYPVERRWSDMRRILDRVSGRVAIVGASMGGGSAMFGVSQGLRPDALVLVDIAPNAARQGMVHVRDFMASGLDGFETLEHAADAIEKFVPHRARPTDLSGLRKNLRRGGDGRWRWHWDPGMINLDLDAERAVLQRCMAALASARDVPMMLVRGLMSDVVTDDTVAELRQQLPALEVCEIGGAGHMVAGDRNDVFAKAVVSFLSRSMPA
jgi:pimeloyl-ACP methyl ester carboxylesterase